eukprot:c17086_g1_i3 orf=97-354(+)
MCRTPMATSRERSTSREVHFLCNNCSSLISFWKLVMRGESRERKTCGCKSKHEMTTPLNATALIPMLCHHGLCHNQEDSSSWSPP